MRAFAQSFSLDNSCSWSPAPYSPCWNRTWPGGRQTHDEKYALLSRLARRRRVRTVRSYPYKLVVVRYLAAAATASPAVPRSES
jgi:hypothetical protein